MQSNQRFEKVLTYFKESYGIVHPFVFVREIQRLYNVHIRDHLADPSDPNRVLRGPAWGAKSIYNRSRQRVMDPQAMRVDALRTIQVALVDLADNGIFKKDAQGKRFVDAKAMELYLKVFKEARPMLKESEAKQSTALINPSA